MNRRALFVASCISLVTTSMVFSIRGDIEGSMSQAFHLTKQQMGEIWSPAFWGFTISIILCGLLVDWLGLKFLHAVSAVGYIAGVALVLVAPPAAQGPIQSIFGDPGASMLFAGFLMMGLSQGIVEGVINPLIATTHTENKTHYLNVLHAWWPAGIMIGGLAAFGLSELGVGWQIKLSLILIPAVIYLFMVLMLKYPETERVAAGVSTTAMLSQVFRPLFLILFACMWLTAATELGPDQWFPSVMGELTGMDSGGVLFLVYTAGLMFVLRFFAGPIAHRISPPGMLFICAILSAAGLYWLGSLSAGSPAYIAFAAATVFGIGKTFFWPTMLAVTAEQFPRGGALLLNLMGGAGMLSIALVLPAMGKQFDELGAGGALRSVAILPVILTVVFALLILFFRARGGYRVRTVDSQD